MTIEITQQQAADASRELCATGSRNQLSGLARFGNDAQKTEATKHLEHLRHGHRCLLQSEVERLERILDLGHINYGEVSWRSASDPVPRLRTMLAGRPADQQAAHNEIEQRHRAWERDRAYEPTTGLSDQQIKRALGGRGRAGRTKRGRSH